MTFYFTKTINQLIFYQVHVLSMSPYESKILECDDKLQMTNKVYPVFRDTGLSLHGIIITRLFTPISTIYLEAIFKTSRGSRSVFFTEGTHWIPHSCIDVRRKRWGIYYKLKQNQDYWFDLLQKQYKPL